MDYSPPGFSVRGISLVSIPRQEYWSRLPFPSPGDLPDPGIEPMVSYVSCIGRQILYHYATWEEHIQLYAVKYSSLFKNIHAINYWLIKIMAPPFKLPAKMLY